MDYELFSQNVEEAKKLWLRALNILVFGTWLMFSILVALTA